MKRLAQLLVLGTFILLPVKGVQAETPKDPIYVNFQRMECRVCTR
jgi:hypothetical protein